jgi:hypothetical protein
MMAIDSESTTPRRRGRSVVPAGIAMAAVLMLAGTGRAVAEYRGTEEQRQACTSDVFRLCSAYIPDVGSIVTCMKARRSQLSPGCRAAFVPGGSTRTAKRSQGDGAERRHTGNHVAHHNERRQNKREAAR